MVATRRSRRNPGEEEDDERARHANSTSGSDSDDAPEEVSLATSRSRVTQERKAQREAQRQAQREAKDLKKSQRETREKARNEAREAARNEAREAAQRAAAEQDDEDEDGVDAEDPAEDRLPEDVLAALTRRNERDNGGMVDPDEEEEEDQRAMQRRIVSQQLRALAKPSNKRKKFGDGRVVASGIVVKSLKSPLATERDRGASASRKFLESRLGRHARDHNGMRGLPTRR